MTNSGYLQQTALLIRLPNSFTVLSNVLAAFVVGSQGAWAWQPLLSLAVASLCFYHGGIVLNDCMDLEEDRRTQPNRPLASGAIPLPVAWAFVAVTLTLGLALLIPLGQDTLLVGALLVAGVIAYNLSPRDGLLGCVIMGVCRGLNWLMVLTAVGGAAAYSQYPVVVAVYVMALTFLSRDEASAERPWLAWLAMAGMTAAAALFLVTLDWQAPLLWLKLGVFGAGLAFIYVKLVQVLRHYNPDNLRGAVMFFVLGLIPLDAALVLISGYPAAAAVVLALIVPSRLLARRLYVS